MVAILKEGDNVKKNTLFRKALFTVIIIFVSGSLLLLGSIISQSGDIPVLNYHRVADGDGNNPLTLSVPEFNEQMAYLNQHGYQSITPDDLLANLQDNAPLPDKPVLITFDDGYRDTYTNAYPILKKYGFTATVFLITDVVGHNDWYVNWQQVKEMHQAGFVIGSHTLRHVPLTTLSPAEALFQLQKSKEGIEWRLGVPVKYFAYPTGAYNAEVIELVKEAGYRAAFSVNFGRTGKTSNIYALERIPIFKARWSFVSFCFRLKLTPLAEITREMRAWFLSGKTLDKAF